MVTLNDVMLFLLVMIVVIQIVSYIQLKRTMVDIILLLGLTIFGDELFEDEDDDDGYFEDDYADDDSRYTKKPRARAVKFGKAKRVRVRL